jgi:hypothetical protein
LYVSACGLCLITFAIINSYRVGDEASRKKGGCDGQSATGCDYRLKPPENEPASSTPPPVFLRHMPGTFAVGRKTKAGNESDSRKSGAKN